MLEAYRNHLNVKDIMMLSSIRLIILTILLTANIAFAQSSFVTLALPQNVSIEVPRNWIVATQNTRMTMEAFADSIGVKMDANYLGFYAESYDQRNMRVASLNLIYLPTSPPLSQSMLRSFSQAKIADLLNGVKEQINQAIKSVGGKLLTWDKPKKVEINGITLVEFGYTIIVPTTGEGVVKMKTLHMFSGPKSFKLTVGYAENWARIYEPITNHIINSLKQTN